MSKNNPKRLVEQRAEKVIQKLSEMEENSPNCARRHTRNSHQLRAKTRRTARTNRRISQFGVGPPVWRAKFLKTSGNAEAPLCECGLRNRFIHWLALWLLMGMSPSLPQPVIAQPAADIATWPAGFPLVEARCEAIASQPFRRPLDRETIRKWMEIASQCTMAECELFLGPLSQEEQQLLAKVEKMPLPIVNRLPFEDLRGVLAKGGLLSLEQEEKLAGGDVRHMTPGIENLLFGAYDCVFASVGPPDGTARYGDVIIRLKDSVREHGWATPTSGMHFMWAVRHKDARQMQALLAAGKTLPAPPNPLSLGFDDRLHFSHQVVTEEAWNRALGYQAILVLRNLDESPTSAKVRQRLQAMLATENPADFWTLFIPAEEPNLSAEEELAQMPFGYLEGKFPDKFAIDDFTSIEVSAEQLKQVCLWPEAKPYRELIRVKSSAVR